MDMGKILAKHKCYIALMYAVFNPGYHMGGLLGTMVGPKKEHKIIIEKRCGKCKLTKQVDKFYKSKNSPDGYGYECRTCNHEKYVMKRDKK